MKCETCGNEYKPRYRKQRFCSELCRRDYSQEERTASIGVCVGCGEKFEINPYLRGNYKGKYCSFECRLRSTEKATDEQILSYLIDNQIAGIAEIGIHDIATHFSIAPTGARKRVERLIASGLIERIGRRKIRII